MPVRSIAFEIFADYRQFYIEDEDAADGPPLAWTEEAVRAMLAVGDGTVTFGTVSNVTVPAGWNRCRRTGSTETTATACSSGSATGIPRGC